MNFYIDEDSIHVHLINLLRRAGHDVHVPTNVGDLSDSDPQVLRHAIQQRRTVLSHNHDDFEELHELVLAATGHHSGILIVRKDNDPARDLTPGGVVRTIEKLQQSGLPIADSFHVLNHWR